MIQFIPELHDIILWYLPRTEYLCAKTITLVEHLPHDSDLVLRRKVLLLLVGHAFSAFRNESLLLYLLKHRTPVQTLTAPGTGINLQQL